jgi:hypothetical protein
MTLYIVKNDTLFEDVTKVSKFFGDKNSYVFFRTEDVIGKHEFYGEMEYTHEDGTEEWMNFAPVDDFLFFTQEEFEKINVEKFKNFFKENGLKFYSMQGDIDSLFFETYDVDGKFQPVTFADGKLQVY